MWTDAPGSGPGQGGAARADAGSGGVRVIPYILLNGPVCTDVCEQYKIHHTGRSFIHAGQFDINYKALAAGSMIALAPAILMFICGKKYLVGFDSRSCKRIRRFIMRKKLLAVTLGCMAGSMLYGCGSGDALADRTGHGGS